MINKHRLVLSSLVISVTTLACLAPKCFAFGEFADGAVTLNTEARFTYDSYFIGAVHPSDGDFYASLYPKLVYSRNAALAQFNGFVGVDFLRYDTNSQYNSENLNAELHMSLPTEGSRLSGTVGIGYHESNEVDYDVLSRIPEKIYTADANLRYHLGLKTSLGEDLTYSNIDRSHFSGQSIFSNNLSFIYSDFLEGTSLRLTDGYTRTTSSGQNFLGVDLDQTSNSLAVGLSRPLYGPLIGEVVYGYRVLDRSAQENVGGQSRQSGSFYSLNLHGPFLPPSHFPKLESSASITYQEADSPGINDLGQKTITGDIRVSWQARERTKVSLSADRSTTLSATDLSVNTSQVRFQVDENLGLSTTVEAHAAYIWRSYPNTNRRDDTFDTGFSVQHHFNRYWSAGGSYEFQNNTDNNAQNLTPLATFDAKAFGYSRHVLSLYVSDVF